MAEGDGTQRNFRSSYYEKLGFSGNVEKDYLDILLSSCSLNSDKLSDLCERFELDRKCVDAWKLILGVECGRKNPFDEFENVRRVREEHFQSLRHHLEVLLRHNIVMKHRLKKSSRNGVQFERLNNSHNSNPNGCPREQTNDCGFEENTVGFNQPVPDQVVDGRSRVSPTSVNGMLPDEYDPLTRGIKLLDNIEANPGNLITMMYLLEAGRLNTSDIYSQLESDYCRKLSKMATFFVNVSHDLQEAFFLFRNFTNNMLNKP